MLEFPGGTSLLASLGPAAGDGDKTILSRVSLSMRCFFQKIDYLDHMGSRPATLSSVPGEAWTGRQTGWVATHNAGSCARSAGTATFQQAFGVLTFLLDILIVFSYLALFVSLVTAGDGPEGAGS